jgi:hypothetical protein
VINIKLSGLIWRTPAKVLSISSQNLVFKNTANLKQDTGHHVFSASPKLNKMICKNSTQTADHLDQASKIHVSPNCKSKTAKTHYHF